MFFSSISCFFFFASSISLLYIPVLERDPGQVVPFAVSHFRDTNIAENSINTRPSHKKDSQQRRLLKFVFCLVLGNVIINFLSYNTPQGCLGEGVLEERKLFITSWGFF